jgi:hypothetical protein
VSPGHQAGIPNASPIFGFPLDQLQIVVINSSDQASFSLAV